MVHFSPKHLGCRGVAGDPSGSHSHLHHQPHCGTSVELSSPPPPSSWRVGCPSGCGNLASPIELVHLAVPVASSALPTNPHPFNHHVQLPSTRHLPLPTRRALNDTPQTPTRTPPPNTPSITSTTHSTTDQKGGLAHGQDQRYPADGRFCLVPGYSSVHCYRNSSWSCLGRLLGQHPIRAMGP